MARWLVERRLTDVSRRLQRARQELAEIDAQLAWLTDTADDSRLRSLVSETPLADHEHRQAQRSADAMARRRAEVRELLTRLERTQDDLLDQLAAEPR